MCAEREKEALQDFHHSSALEVHRELITWHSELSLGEEEEEEERKEDPHIGRRVKRDSPPTQHTHRKPRSERQREKQCRNRQKKNIAQ